MIGSRSTLASWVFEDAAIASLGRNAARAAAAVTAKAVQPDAGGEGDENFTDAAGPDGAGGSSGTGAVSLSRYGMNATSGDVVCIAVLACIMLQVLLPLLIQRWEQYCSTVILRPTRCSAGGAHQHGNAFGMSTPRA